jgi:hypothetical protein
MGTLSKDNFINYYDILEVDPRSSSFEVYQAYLKVKKTYSLRDPQMFKNFTFDEIQELLTLIEEAYSTIGNEETRVIYDGHFFKVYPHLKSKIGPLDFSEPVPRPNVSAEAVRPPELTISATPPNAALAPNPVANSQTAKTSHIPAGLGKTSLSSYEIDEAFEAQIQNQDFFDGVFLGKIRKYKKIKIEDMSQKTCISPKYLYAIEDNNYNALPAAVFTRGYILQYCKMLGLDADKVVTTFMKLYQNGRE